jgi:hypothetical protein
MPKNRVFAQNACESLRTVAFARSMTWKVFKTLRMYTYCSRSIEYNSQLILATSWSFQLKIKKCSTWICIFLTNPYEKLSWPAGQKKSKLGRNFFDYCAQQTSERVAFWFKGQEVKYVYGSELLQLNVLKVVQNH